MQFHWTNKWRILSKLISKIEHIFLVINIRNFNSSLLKVDKKSCKEIGIYNIGYVTVKEIGHYENINSVNLNEVDGFIDESSRNKYLTDGNEELIRKVHKT